ncbi:MAG: hypothetical protein WD425_21185 [Nitrospirales bacterium]
MLTSTHDRHTLQTSMLTTRLLVMTLCGVCAWSLLSESSTSARAEQSDNSQEANLIPGERVIMGIVEEIRGDQAKVNTGEVQPRYLPMNIRKEKGLPALKEGDKVEMTVNDQNLLVDLHLQGETSQHKKIHGILTQPLVTGHNKAVIQSDEKKEEAFLIRPLARSKVASVPVGAEATFLIDEMNQIVDVTYSGQKEVDKAQGLVEKKTPLKASFKKVTGVLVQPLKENTISIKENGKEQQYEVRSLVQKKIKALSPGQSIVLFIDDENKVTDVSFEKEKS